MPDEAVSQDGGRTADRLTRTSLRRMIEGAASILTAAGVPSPRHDAEELAAWCLGVPRLEWALLPETGGPLGDGPAQTFVEEFAEVVERRRLREPLQRIVEHTVFRHITVRVEDEVFIPRPETEVVAQVAVDEAARLVAQGLSPSVVDLCCGSGVIGISVDVEVPGSRVVAVDVSPDAVRMTAANAAAVGSLTQQTLVGDVRDPDLLAALDGTVDVVVANPPYIPPHAEPLEPEVRDHDPDLALYGGGLDGLDLPRAVVVAAARLLRPGGLLVMEHAEVQAAGAREVVAATGAFQDVHTRQDLTGRDRMVVARRRPSAGDDVKDSRP